MVVAVLAVGSLAGTDARAAAASHPNAVRHKGRHAKPAPAHSPVRTIFADGFEAEAFSGWSQVQVDGDAKAVVQTQFVKAGAVAAELTESANRRSSVDLRKTFAAQQMNVTASGNFDVLQQGAHDLALLRLLDPRWRPIATVYRTNRAIEVAYGGRRVTTRGKLAIGKWAAISLHVAIKGGHSMVEVRLNGRRIYRTRRAALGGNGVSTLQLGNGIPRQPFTLAIDQIKVHSARFTKPSPPIDTVPPSVLGTPQAGQTVSANEGRWIGKSPIKYTHRWLRCNSNGASCRAIAGARGEKYMLAQADVGNRLRVVVTAVNSAGRSHLTSGATAVVQPASSRPVNTAPPAISGTPQAGQLLNAVPGTWSGTQPISYSYQWMRCNAGGAACAPIAGGPSYQATSADVGQTLRISVTAVNVAGSATAIGAPTGVVQASPLPPDLVALWHMDETSGTAMFDSIGGHKGALSHVQLGLPGVAGFAYGFNGSSSYVSVPSARSLNPGSADVTVTIHLQTSGTPPASPLDWDLIRKGDFATAGSEFKMEFQQSGQASCGFEGTTGYSELIAGPKINDGQWHTIQCVKTSSEIEVVVDGVAYAQAAAVGPIANSSPVVIGAHPGADWYQGALDEASIQIG